MAKPQRASVFTSKSFVTSKHPAAGIGVSPGRALSGTLSVIRTIEGNFAIGPFDADIHVPRGYLFFPRSCGLVLRKTEDVGVLGQVRFGTPDDRDKYLLATFVNVTDDFEMEEWFIRDVTAREGGVSVLSGGLATAGILTQALGYLFFVGLMVKR